MFPFLAVLICTMGALIVLLIIITHQAAAQAKREAVEQHSQRKTDLAQQREDAAWRSDILKNSLEKTREKFAELREKLGYLESDTTRLRDEVVELAKTLKRLEEEKPTTQNIAGLEDQLAQLQAKIVTTRRTIDEQMTKVRGKTRSYAVVPYQGPNETRRYPIYVECRSDGVVLQPEGIRLGESDFIGFFGPDNPLAAALRAKAGYLQQKYQFSEEAGRPYPLILVRQSGIDSYCAAMEAMRSWDSEFGYELVDDDMDLDFTEPDPRLQQLVQQEIEYARSKRQALAEAVPRVYNDPTLARSGGGSGGGRQYYSVSSGQGGIVPYQGDTSDLDMGGSSKRSASRHPDYRSGTGRYGANEVASDGTTGFYPTATSSYPTATSKDSLSNLGGSGYDVAGRGNGYGPGGSTATGTTLAGSGANPAGGVGGTPGSFGPNPTGTAQAGNNSAAYASAPASESLTPLGVQEPPRLLTPGDPGVGNYYGNSVQGQPQGTGQSQGSGGYAQASGANSSQAQGQGTPGSNGAASNSMVNGQTAEAPLGIGEWQPNSGSPSQATFSDQPRAPDPFAPAHRQPREKPQSVAKERGKDWCLPKEAAYRVPLSRPVSIEAYPDRFVFRPTQNGIAAKTIPLGEQTGGSVNELVSAVWDRVESWGMAGQGMYWRPVLYVHVQPGAEARFDDLQALFHESGFIVEQKK